jgi:hypothetical protein
MAGPSQRFGVGIPRVERALHSSLRDACTRYAAVSYVQGYYKRFFREFRDLRVTGAAVGCMVSAGGITDGIRRDHSVAWWMGRV